MATGQTNIWVSADGDWNLGTSWGLGTIPVDGELVIFPANNSQAPTTNLDRTADGTNGLNLALLQVDAGFTPDLGGSGNPLMLSATKVVHRGSGTLWYKDEQDVPGNVTDHVIIEGSLLTGTGAANLDGNEIARLTCNRGKVTVAATLATAIARLESSFIRNQHTDVQVVLTAAGPAITLFICAGGVITSDVAITTLIMRNGVLTQDTADITTLHEAGGRVNYNTEDTGGAPYNFATANVIGGVLDFTQNTRMKGVADLTVFPQGVVLRNVDLVTFTIENVYSGGFVGESIPGGLGVPGGGIQV